MKSNNVANQHTIAETNNVSSQLQSQLVQIPQRVELRVPAVTVQRFANFCRRATRREQGSASVLKCKRRFRDLVLPEASLLGFGLCWLCPLQSPAPMTAPKQADGSEPVTRTFAQACARKWTSGERVS